MLIPNTQVMKQEGDCGGQNSNSMTLNNEVRARRGRFRLAGATGTPRLAWLAQLFGSHAPTTKRKPQASTPQPGPTERRCSRLASPLGIPVPAPAESFGARHLRDSC